MKQTLIILVFVLVSTLQLSAKDQLNSVIKITCNSKPQNIGSSVQHFVDSSNKLTIDEICTYSYDNKFVNSTSETPNFNMTSSTVWTKFELSAHSDPLLLELANRRLDQVSLYTRENGVWKHQKLGDHLPLNIKYLSRHYLFDIPPSNTSQVFYLEIRSRSPILFPLSIGSLLAYFNEYTIDNFVNGLYYGLLIIIFVSNLFYFFAVKDRVYLIYVLYIALFSFCQAFVNGYTNLLLNIKVANWINTYPTVIPGLMFIVAIWFAQELLQPNRYLPKVNALFYTLYFVFLLNIAADLLDETATAYYIVQFASIISTIFLLIASLLVYLKGNKSARFYLLGWSFLLLGISVYVLREWGVVPVNFITVNFMQIGSAVEVTFLSFALADKINIYKKEKEVAQRLALEVATENQEILKYQNIVLEQKVEERTMELKNEKQKSDDLLLNILPQEVAEELKAKGEAEAMLFDEVTVLFTDFKDFTALSEKLSPKELVRDLNECFSAFDRIMQNYGIEKIKTIGDAYMAAGGLPVPNTTHAVDVVRAAIEIRDYMLERIKRKHSELSPYFEIRIGVHSGPVVAGIVGVRKFAYDIWGDTVNTASRMESSGEAGKVNISESTYELVKDQFNCVYRGKITAKGKGDIDMYFVVA